LDARLPWMPAASAPFAPPARHWIEAVLRLFIAEDCSTVQKHATIWKGSSRTVCHTKNEVSCSYVAQNVERKKIVGRKVRNGAIRRWR